MTRIETIRIVFTEIGGYYFSETSFCSYRASHLMGAMILSLKSLTVKLSKVG